MMILLALVIGCEPYDSLYVGWFVQSMVTTLFFIDTINEFPPLWFQVRHGPIYVHSMQNSFNEFKSQKLTRDLDVPPLTNV